MAITGLKFNPEMHEQMMLRFSFDMSVCHPTAAGQLRVFVPVRQSSPLDRGAPKHNMEPQQISSFEKVE